MRNVITPKDNLLACTSQASFLKFFRAKVDYLYKQRVSKYYMY